MNPSSPRYETTWGEAGYSYPYKLSCSILEYYYGLYDPANMKIKIELATQILFKIVFFSPACCLNISLKYTKRIIKYSRGFSLHLLAVLSQPHIFLEFLFKYLEETEKKISDEKFSDDLIWENRPFFSDEPSENFSSENFFHVSSRYLQKFLRICVAARAVRGSDGGERDVQSADCRLLWCTWGWFSIEFDFLASLF